MADVQAPPIERYTLSIWLSDLEETVKVLDQLRFVSWTIRSAIIETTAEVEITFNQFCQPIESEIEAEV